MSIFLNNYSDPAREVARLEQAIRDVHQRLNPHTRSYVEEAIERWEQEGKQHEFIARPQLEENILLRADFVRRPVPVRQFILDPSYLGKVWKNNIYGPLVDDLEEFLEGPYMVALLAGGIGWGKTTFADIGILYDVYQVSCLRDPAQTFGMRTGSNIAFINVATTLKQARKVLFGGLSSMLQQSPYFQQVFPFDKKVKSELRFPKRVIAYPATASPEGVLGEGIFSAAIDEANFMELVERSKRSVPGDTGLYDQAEQTFNKLEFRITSRMNKKGRVPGHIYVISSARYPGDFTERMEARAATPEGQHIFVRHYPAWGTRPKSVYLGGTFKVEVGDTTRRSRVLEGNEENVNWERVIDVPMDFEPKFRADTEWAVRDLAGISTLSISPFIVRREAIQRMFDQGVEHGLKHPFWPQDEHGLPLPVTLQHPDPHAEYLIPENLHWVERQKENALDRPMFEDGEPVMEKILCPVLYHAHIDLSQTRCATGLCVTHMVGTKMCERVQLVEGDLRNSYEEKPIIWVDLVLEIRAPAQGEIDIPKVRAVLYNLAQLGMQFGSITFDTYGSQETLKTLKDKGYPAEEFSLDRTKEGYEQLKEAIYDERIWCYPHPLLQREMGQLEDAGKKIEKPSFPGASKDLADALAGAVHGCEEGWRRGEMVGGLFKIGMVERPGELPEEVVEQIRGAGSRVVQGQPLQGKDEDSLLFAEQIADMLKTDKERFGHFYKKEDDDGTV